MHINRSNLARHNSLSHSFSAPLSLSFCHSEVASNSANFNYVQHLVTGLFAFASASASASASVFVLASAFALSKQCANKGRGSKGAFATVCCGLRRTTICFELAHNPNECLPMVWPMAAACCMPHVHTQFRNSPPTDIRVHN